MKKRLINLSETEIQVLKLNEMNRVRGGGDPPPPPPDDPDDPAGK